MTSKQELDSLVGDAETLSLLHRKQIEDAQILVRTQAVTGYLDQVHASHISRIFASSESAFILLRRGSVADAACVTRAMIEHLTSLLYIDSHEDASNMAYRFLLSGVSHFISTHDKLQAIYPDRFEQSEDEKQVKERWKKAIAVINFTNSFDKQIDYLDSISKSDSGLASTSYAFLRDAIHGELSLHVHPRSVALQWFNPDPHKPFTVTDPFIERHAALVVLGIVLCTSSAAEVARITWGLQVPTSLHELDQFLERHGSALNSVPTLTFNLAHLLNDVKLSRTPDAIRPEITRKKRKRGGRKR